MPGQTWAVIGGADKGGIVVRGGPGTDSPQAPERLAFGALVRERELRGERLLFELLSGSGPQEGWASTRLQTGKDLLVPADGLWEVVGGGDKGGLVVREGLDTASPQAPERLSHGAWVRELELQGERLHFQRLTGSGPSSGWASTRLQGGKELLVRLVPAAEGASGESSGDGGSQEGSKLKEAGLQNWSPYEVLGVQVDATDAIIKSSFRKASLRVHPDRCPDDPEAAARFRELVEAKDFLLDPRRRRDYNMAHGLLQQQLNASSARWWSDWDFLFDEIDAGDDESEEALAGGRPEAPLADAQADILIVGATGLAGMLTCSLIRQLAPGRTWAIAGRCGWKLDLIRDKFGLGPCFRGAMRVETEADMERAARTARVVIDVSGPKWQVDGMIARACVRAGAHYIENTGVPGDILAARRVRDSLDQEAKSAGVALLLCCGWSSVWVDFGVWLVVRHLHEKHGARTLRVDEYRVFKGFNVGGTHVLGFRGPDGFEKELQAVGGEFPLGGARSAGVRKEDQEFKGFRYDEYFGVFLINGLPPDKWVSRCSCAMFEASQPYGERFLQQAWEVHPDKHSKDMGQVAQRFMRANYDRNLADQKIASPGQGPKERIRKESSFSLGIVAEADEDSEERHKAYCLVSAGHGGMNDPYECTATMLIEAARCFLDAADSGAGPTPGFGTPVWHLAHLGFLERLQARGGNFTVLDGPPPRNMVLGLYDLSAVSISA